MRRAPTRSHRRRSAARPARNVVPTTRAADHRRDLPQQGRRRSAAMLALSVREALRDAVAAFFASRRVASSWPRRRRRKSCGAPSRPFAPCAQFRHAMSERLFARLAARLARGEALALACVLATSGAAPRRRGALMLVGADDAEGSIGGGEAEARGSPRRGRCCSMAKATWMCRSTSAAAPAPPVSAAGAWTSRCARGDRASTRCARGHRRRTCRDVASRCRHGTSARNGAVAPASRSAPARGRGRPLRPGAVPARARARLRRVGARHARRVLCRPSLRRRDRAVAATRRGSRRHSLPARPLYAVLLNRDYAADVARSPSSRRRDRPSSA